MQLLEAFSRWFEMKWCNHRQTMIAKYNSEGDRLPVAQQHYYCLTCHKSLETLNYLPAER